MKPHSKQIIRILWIIFFGAWGLIFVLFSLISLGVIGYMPAVEQLQNPIDKYASQLISVEGDPLGAYAQSGDNRVYVAYEDISPNVINALIATEDVRFRQHSGIDFRSLLRAFVKRGILRQSNAGGGSTITQQLAKQLYSPPVNNILARLFQKPIEWVIASKLERFYTKEEILSMYLNKFDFLYNAVGIKSAAYTYYGKTPAQLTLDESAMLVGMCKNPSLFNPVLHKDTDRPKMRRNVVFQQMEKAGILSDAEVSSLSALPLKINFHRISHKDGLAPYFREYLRKILMADKPSKSNYASWQMQQFHDDSLAWETNPIYGWCKKHKKADGSNYNIYTDGLKIYTTISIPMQKYAEEAMTKHMTEVLQPAFDREMKGNKYAPFSNDLTTTDREKIILKAMKQSDRWRVSKEAGMSESEILTSFRKKTKMQVWSWHGTVDTVMTPMDSVKYMKSFLRSGFVAMNPANGHVLAYVGGIDFNAFQYDMVSTGRRQTGSIIKPFLYSLSMIEGITPCDMMMHVQQVLYTEAGKPWAPKNSNNKLIGEMVSIQWGLQNSDNWVTAYLMSRTSPYTFVRLLRSYGLQGPMDAEPSICLGTPDATVGEMVSGYTTFVNKGIRVAPLPITHIEDQYGNVVANFTPQMTEVLPQDATLKMLYMLQSVVNGGTASRLKYRYNLDMPLGGKTGTTQNNSDAWFIGFTPKIVAGCWVGGEERSIRFRSMNVGQGAAAALPIFAEFIKHVYANPKLGYNKKDAFDIPPGFSPCGGLDSGDIVTIPADTTQTFDEIIE